MGRHTIMQHSRWYHYPYPTAINVNGPVGGMEYPMIVFCSERRDRLGLYRHHPRSSSASGSR